MCCTLPVRVPSLQWEAHTAPPDPMGPQDHLDHRGPPGAHTTRDLLDQRKYNWPSEDAHL